ncbi:MAG: response regulator [Deltaproteobacteria bacterium]|nr:response regulator [Deltaproteobacteria bacterium]
MDEGAGRILIVEDNPDFAANIAESLELEGHRTRTASTVAQALALAREEGFDLCLLDVRLPDAPGTDALVGLKALAPHGEVIVMSGDATLESALATVRGGAFAYLLKPFAVEELLRLTALALGQVHLRQERERLVEELRGSEARYRAVVEASPAIIVGVDDRGKVAMVNAAVERTTGWGRDELLGRPFAEALLPASVRPGAWPANEPRESPVCTRDGRERRVEWRYGAARDLRYAIGLDVTETRTMERRARVAEHLAVVGELTAGLAHEVRNPLNSALLELKVLVRRLTRAGDTQGLASAQSVQGELERLERLLADFLWFARPRSVEPLPGDPASPARTVARLVAAEAQEKNITVVTDFSQDTPAVPFDEDRVRQVLFNLVRNAIEALGQDGTIILRARPVGRDAELSVEDDGPGIQGDPSRVFRPFHTTKASGTGLGLTIAQRIAADHGGELRVESAPGRTVFTLLLPGARG